MRLLPRTPATPPRKNLVILRAGEGSVHELWQKDIADEQRSWDLLVSFFGEDETTVAAPHEYLVRQRGRKYAPILELWRSGELPSFDHVWLPDDDVETSWGDINAMFALMASHRLLMAQPALSEDSFVSHAITRARPSLELRWTSFVEVMCPLFSRAAFERIAPSFEGAVTGWGLDFAWPKILGYPRDGIAIFDSVVVRHKRPVGASYDAKAAFAEKHRVMKKYGVREEARTYAVLPREVPSPEAAGPAEDRP